MNHGAEVARPTQSFVATLTWLRRRPLLLLLEITWRWVFGIPTLWLCWHYGAEVLATTAWRETGITQLSVNRMLTDPMGGSAVLAAAVMVFAPPVIAVAKWLAPILIFLWTVLCAAGRTFVLRRMSAEFHARFGTLFVLNVLRLIPMAATAWLWWTTLSSVAQRTILLPVSEGGEPQMMLYIGTAIALTLGLFVLWAAVGWIFGIAPLLAMLHNVGPAKSIAAAFRLGPVRGSLVEINLVMGVVKIALLVLLMVFSATPLPFQSSVTDTFLFWWTAGVAVLYFAASDFFHVARLAGYLHLLQRGPAVETDDLH